MIKSSVLSAILALFLTSAMAAQSPDARTTSKENVSERTVAQADKKKQDAETPAVGSPTTAPTATPAGKKSSGGRRWAFYFGGGGGMGMWAADTTTINTTTGVCRLCIPIRQGGQGAFGTVTAGADFKVGSKWIVGGMFDYDFGRIKGTIQDQDPFSVATANEKWAWDVGARVGLMVAPRVLVYTSGGYTSARFDSGVAVRGFNGAQFSPSVTYQNIRDKGAFAGVGAEYFFKHGWFWRGEYRWAGFKGRNFLACSSAGCGTANTFNSIHFVPKVETGRVEFGYRFGEVDDSAGSGSSNSDSRRWAVYFGGGGGMGMWTADTTTVDSVTGACFLCTNQRQGGQGPFGTVSTGVDFRVGSKWLVGGLFDYDFASIKGHIQDQGPYSVAPAKEKWAWDFGARLGYMIRQNVLVYASGGYISASFASGAAVNNPAGGTPFTPPINYQGFTDRGAFGGVGAEYYFHSGWFTRGEYRFAGFDGKDFVACSSAGCGTVNTSFASIHAIPKTENGRIVIGYRFGYNGH